LPNDLFKLPAGTSAVTDATRVVDEWASNIKKIEAEFGAANLARANAKKIREANALKASMGDAGALAAVKHARSEQHTAEQTIDDLKIALPEAEAQLAAAEKAATSARNQLARFNAEILMRKRIDVAGQLDAAIAAFADLYREYEKIGDEIINMPDVMPRNLHGISNVEGTVGARRVRASLPRFFWKLFPGAIHDETNTKNLAAAEARFWNLAPEQTEKAKAA
jgi:hypothetical protein